MQVFLDKKLVDFRQRAKEAIYVRLGKTIVLHFEPLYEDTKLQNLFHIQLWYLYK